MIHKIIIFVCCAFFFFLTVGIYSPAFAQIPTLPPVVPGVKIPQPGVNCGIISADTNLSRCCEFEDITPQIPSLNPNPTNAKELVDKIFKDAAIGAINTLIKDVSKPILSPINETIKAGLKDKECIEGKADRLSVAGQCFCTIPDADEITALQPMCESIKNNAANPNAEEEAKLCEGCHKGEGIWTGLGCIYVDPVYFIQKTVFSWGIGIAGSLGLVCIIYAAFMIQTSRGNPERVKKAQELLTSCITGLLLIIFSVFILRVIGVDILQIPFLKIE